MTRQEEAAYYMECAGEVAKWIGQLEVMQMRLEHISDERNDNGDPDFEAHQSIETLGKFLGALICYYMDTLEEIENDKQKENENGKRHGESPETLCSEVQDEER